MKGGSFFSHPMVSYIVGGSEYGPNIVAVLEKGSRAPCKGFGVDIRIGTIWQFLRILGQFPACLLCIGALIFGTPPIVTRAQVGASRWGASTALATSSH